ncbi:outer membrane protein assembly factor BamE [Polaromonas sp.]|uniref:outer membrane protein assembly factor BamE n=1 Tax=Polaromonas sp. TaxID=1869339 RepID=UPI0025EB94FF|nr:outer membrane protein assembly factor BamE [Polaromonas sp.]
MSANHRYCVQTAFIVMACAVLGACSSMSSSSINPVNWITPYKVDVIQGNFVSKEQVEQLRPGLSRDEVKALLGTPLMTSLFHVDRWDYVFTMKRQGVEPQSFKYTVFFKGDQLERFEGDAMPSEAEFVSKLSNQRKLGKIPPLEASEAQLKAAEKVSAARADAKPAVASESTSPQTTVYPPLESPRQ